MILIEFKRFIAVVERDKINKKYRSTIPQRHKTINLM